jgi:ABC-type sulfate transport system permease subunit
MKDLGYESHNSLQLLGSLFIFAVLYYVRVIFFYPLVLIFNKLFKKGEVYLRSLRNQLFFSEIIIINLEAFLELLVAGYINYIFPLNSTDGEIFA